MFRVLESDNCYQRAQKRYRSTVAGKQMAKNASATYYESHKDTDAFRERSRRNQQTYYRRVKMLKEALKIPEGSPLVILDPPQTEEP